MSERFWESKSLKQLTSDEWESLCDGCGQCCLVKLEDDETGEVFRTNASCKLLDVETCRCQDYVRRLQKVPECVQVTLERPEQFEWMPVTCAYRLLYEGKPLFEWHPLVSGTAKTVHTAGISIQAFAISEEYIHPDQLEDHISDKIK